jgi:hypothetical protein
VESGFRAGLGDPLNNTVVAAMYGRYASVVSREDRRVRLRPGGGFSTDLEGTIDVDPRPLSPSAPVEDQIIVTWGGIEHELAHEQWSPRQVLHAAGRIARGQTDHAYSGKSGEDLSPGARGQLKHWLNIIEDGRVERLLRDAAPGAFKRIRASDVLEPRWDEAVGEGVPLCHQLMGAALYEALPNFTLRSDVCDRMSEEARLLSDRLRPIVKRGVRGDAGGALRAAVDAVELLDGAGVFKGSPGIPPDLKVGAYAGSPEADGDAVPGPGDGTPVPVNACRLPDQGGADGSGPGPARCPACGSFKPAAGVCPRCGGAGTKGDGPWTGNEGDGGGIGSESSRRNVSERTPSGQQDGSDGTGDVSGGNESGERADGASGVPRPAGDGGGNAKEEAEELLNDLRAQASRTYVQAIDDHVEETARGEAQRVHDGKRHVKVTYAEGTLVALDLTDPAPPGGTDLRRIRVFRDRYAGAARRFARELDAIKTEVEADRRFRRRGWFDRRRMKAAVKGDKRVYYRRGVEMGQDIAVALQVDRSSSMRCHDIWNEEDEAWIRTRPIEEAAKAAVVTSMALEQAGIPFEIRSFHGPGQKGNQCIHKVFSEADISDERLGELLVAEGRTPMKPAVELTRASLSARSERVKLAFILADGQPTPESSADNVRNGFDAMEAQGITPVLVFAFPGELDPDMRKRLDGVAGGGRWEHVRSPGMLHRIVSDRIRDIYRNAKRRGA